MIRGIGANFINILRRSDISSTSSKSERRCWKEDQLARECPKSGRQGTGLSKETALNLKLQFQVESMKILSLSIMDVNLIGSVGRKFVSRNVVSGDTSVFDNVRTVIMPVIFF
jgi:hypothetical protein